jgi:hypothetical protein
LLTTILWGNVGINVLLTLLSGSVMAGIMAFLFSTVAITMVGEILPQAYFSRNALKIGAMLSPILRFYQFLLYPVAKPSALLLDRWLGPEGLHFFRESDFREVIKMHIHAEEAEVDHVEGAGALNFLAIDDLAVSLEGEPIDPNSILPLPFSSAGLPEFPHFERRQDDPFLRKLERSGKKWVIITDKSDRPCLALDADGFLRNVLFDRETLTIHRHCHRPIIVTDARDSLGDILKKLEVHSREPGDDVIDHDLILVWAGGTRRIITGADILGRLMRGISTTIPLEGTAHL